MRVIDTIEAVLKHKGSIVWWISPDSTVFEAIRLMAEKNIGALLVLDHQGRLLGIFTERDYTRKIALLGRSSKDTLVRDAITDTVVVATTQDTVERCMFLMTENRIRHLPILRDNRVVGVVSLGDLVNWVIRVQTHAIEQLENYVAGQYPG